jgi:hypothetical protein
VSIKNSLFFVVVDQVCELDEHCLYDVAYDDGDFEEGVVVQNLRMKCWKQPFHSKELISVGSVVEVMCLLTRFPPKFRIKFCAFFYPLFFF